MERLPGARNLGRGRRMRVILRPFSGGVTMWFKNLVLYRLPAPWPADPTPWPRSLHDFRCSAVAGPSGRRGLDFAAKRRAPAS